MKNTWFYLFCTVGGGGAEHWYSNKWVCIVGRFFKSNIYMNLFVWYDVKSLSIKISGIRCRVWMQGMKQPSAVLYFSRFQSEIRLDILLLTLCVYCKYPVLDIKPHGMWILGFRRICPLLDLTDRKSRLSENKVEKIVLLLPVYFGVIVMGFIKSVWCFEYMGLMA